MAKAKARLFHEVLTEAVGCPCTEVGCCVCDEFVVGLLVGTDVEADNAALLITFVINNGFFRSLYLAPKLRETRLLRLY